MTTASRTPRRRGALLAAAAVVAIGLTGCGRDQGADEATPPSLQGEADTIAPTNPEPTTTPEASPTPSETGTGLPTRAPELSLDDFDQGQPIAGSDSVFTANPGQCLAGPEPGARIPCENSHRAEVFFTFNLMDGDYPGDEVVSDEATAQCGAQLGPYLGTESPSTLFTVVPLTPSQETWEDDGDTEVLCLLVPGEPTTSSAFQSER